MSTSPQRASGALRSQRQIQRAIDQVRSAAERLEREAASSSVSVQDQLNALRADLEAVSATVAASEDGSGNTALPATSTPGVQDVTLEASTAPSPENSTAIVWQAGVSGTKDGTAYDAADVLITSVDSAGVSKTLLVLDHSAI